MNAEEDVDLGFKLQYIYCWMCFVKEYGQHLYLTDTIVLENPNTVTFSKGCADEVTLYYQSELDIVQILIDNDQLWLDVTEQELNNIACEYTDN